MLDFQEIKSCVLITSKYIQPTYNSKTYKIQTLDILEEIVFISKF
jgi:hypothetical protein